MIKNAIIMILYLDRMNYQRKKVSSGKDFVVSCKMNAKGKNPDAFS